MVSEESEPKISVTPLNRASKFQKSKNQKTIVEVDEAQFQAYDVTLNGRDILVHYNNESGEIIIDGELYPTKVEELGRIITAQVKSDHAYTIEYHEGQIFLEGRLIDFNFQEAMPKLNRRKGISSSKETILAPLPGQVINIAVEIGDKVSSGTKILTLEAMKMQNDILCQVDGIIKEMYVKEGDQVGTNQKLVLIQTEIE